MRENVYTEVQHKIQGHEPKNLQKLASLLKSILIFGTEEPIFINALTSKSQSDVDIIEISKYITAEFFLVDFLVGFFFSHLTISNIMTVSKMKTNSKIEMIAKTT